MHKQDFRRLLYTVKELIDRSEEFEAQIHDRTCFNYYEELCEEVFPNYSYNWLTSTSFKLFVWNLMSFVMYTDKEWGPKNLDRGKNVVNFMKVKGSRTTPPNLRIVN